MRWDRASTDENKKPTIPGSWLDIYYYDALTVLFRVENALRIFVYVVLKNELHENWHTLNITSDDANAGTIASIARRRKAQDDSYGYLGYSSACPFMHLTSGELIRLLTSDSLWRCFRDHFPASRELVRTKLDEIGNVRNSLAHFRPLKPEDVELVRQNATHILSGVEKVLISLSNCEQVVPTNTAEPWYL